MIRDQLTHSSSWVGRTAGEIREVGESDGSILIVPVGSVEQHGDHLPVGTDTLLASAVATRGAELASDVPVAVTPPIWSGYSPHHLQFGGTLTLSFETALAVVEDVVSSGLENGFDAVLLVNGHGGNGPLVGAAVSEIGVDHPDAEVTGITYFSLAESFADEIRDSEDGGMAHGGEFETSLLLHLYPDLVREDGDATPLEEPYDLGDADLLAPGPLSVYRSFEEYSESGAIGEPELASAEKGRELFERLGDELETLLREIHERNRDT
ncbi:creatininase family protein [Natronobacterium texcoconense]|uniref:Creatinine amidohydrolase n=1 Tax=Natronobacterium texcoconense TaxID=1095778 RepID=A0A1H1FUL9_NATTX|nr:creatininase family protein [Natronobacterium texcoconense]SDR04713.1 creatinine amidohydrolase [Natronobacterium texcoconense]